MFVVVLVPRWAPIIRLLGFSPRFLPELSLWAPGPEPGPQPVHCGEASGRARVRDVVRRERGRREEMCIVVV